MDNYLRNLAFVVNQDHIHNGFIKQDTLSEIDTYYKNRINEYIHLSNRGLRHHKCPIIIIFENIHEDFTFNKKLLDDQYSMNVMFVNCKGHIVVRKNKLRLILNTGNNYLSESKCEIYEDRQNYSCHTLTISLINCEDVQLRVLNDKNSGALISFVNESVLRIEFLYITYIDYLHCTMNMDIVNLSNIIIRELTMHNNHYITSMYPKSRNVRIYSCDNLKMVKVSGINVSIMDVIISDCKRLTNIDLFSEYSASVIRLYKIKNANISINVQMLIIFDCMDIKVNGNFNMLCTNSAAKYDRIVYNECKELHIMDVTFNKSLLDIFLPCIERVYVNNMLIDLDTFRKENKNILMNKIHYIPRYIVMCIADYL